MSLCGIIGLFMVGLFFLQESFVKDLRLKKTTFNRSCVICLDDSILQSSGDCGIVRDGITQAVNCESERYVSCKIKGKLKHLILKT